MSLWSAGFQVQKAAVFNPLDYWGFGYAETRTHAAADTGLVGQFTERMVEGYYNFLLSEKLRLSVHVQHAFEIPANLPSYGFIVPAVRLQARF